MARWADSRFFWAAAIFAAVLALYWPCRRFSFVRLDDQDYVYRNAHIRGGLTAECAGWAFADVGYASNWHPLTWLSLALDVSAARALGMEVDRTDGGGASWTDEHGPLAHVMHLHNVALHAANAALLALLAASLCGRAGPFGALCALAWAVHPLRCEAVCWVSERKELLAAFFMLAAFILHVRRGRAAYLLSLASFALALLSKPVAVSLPAALLAWRWCVRREPFGRAALRAAPYAALAAAVCIVTLGAQEDARAVGDAVMGWGMRAVTAVEAPAVYLRQTAWPSGLCALYPTRGTVDWPHFAGGLLLLAAMGAGVLRWFARRDRLGGLCLFAVAWCYMGLVPMLGLVKVGGQPHSDRYTYWVGCGAAAVAAMLWTRCEERGVREGVRRAALGALALAVGAWGFAGALRCGAWRDSLALYADAVERTADEDSALILADEMCRRVPDGPRAAIAMLRDVVAARKTPKARGGLALFMAMYGGTLRGDSLGEARMFARKALEEDAACCEAHAALGFADMAEGNMGSAAAHMRAAFAHGYVNSRIAAQIGSWEKAKDEEGMNESQ